MADQGGWNVVSSTPLKSAAPTQMSGGDGWNVVSSVPDEPAQPIAAPVNASGLVSPDDAVAAATQSASILATHVLGMAQNPPGVPSPPLPFALQSDQQQAETSMAGGSTFQNPRTGRISPRQLPGKEGGLGTVLDSPVTGGQRVGEGVSQMAEPGLRAKAGGAHKVFTGALEAATPLMVGAAAVAPVATAATLATGTAAQTGTEWLAKKFGMPEEYAAVLGDLTGLFVAAKTPKTIEAVKAKYEPVLKARASKVTAPAPEEYSSTGQPVRRGETPSQPAQPAAAPVEKAGWNVVKSEPLPKEKTHETQTTVTASVTATGTDGKPAAGGRKPEAKAEGGEKPAEKQPVLKPEQTTVTHSFETSKGSQYETVGKGTRRNKVATGQQFDPSDQTVYIKPDVNKRVMEDLQANNVGNLKASVRAVGDGKIGIVVKDRDTNALRNDLSKTIPVSDTPEVGLHPLELWHKNPETGEYGFHLGHPIGKLSSETKTLPAETKAPIVETKPKGAETPSPKIETPTAAQPAQPVAAGVAPEALAAKIEPGANDVRPNAGGEERALHGNAPAGQRRIVGKAAKVVIDGRSIPIRYEVRELDDSHASHNGETFSPNPKYGLKNERDYSKPENQQRVIENGSEEKFDPTFHINNNPDLVNGPPLLDEDSNALGGNQRRMQLERVYGRNGGKAAQYRQLLHEDAHIYGINPAAMADMKRPGLFRVLAPGALDDIPGGSKWAIRKTNVSGTAALSSSERAAADAGQMSPEMMHHIAGAIEDAGADATLNDALTGKSGTAIVNRLIVDGFFNEQERPGLMDGKTGVLTQSAKDRISKALLGKFFRDSDQIARTPTAIKSKLERIAAPLAKVAGNPEWDITADVQQAIDLTEYAGAHGIKNLADVVSQDHLFGEAPEWTPGAVKLAQLLRDSKPNDVVAAFRKYVNSKEPTMFGESTPDEAFKDAFGADKPEARPQPAQSVPVRETGERGPVFREFRHDEAGATAALEKRRDGEAIGALEDRKFGHGDVDLVWGYEGDGPPAWKKGRGLSHILAKHPWLKGHLQEMLDRMTEQTPHGPERVDLSNEQGEHAVLALTWFGRENKTWLLTEYDPQMPVSGRILDGSGSPVSGAGEPTSPPTGSSSVAEGPAPEPRKPSGPVYLGSGLGALEPLFREAKEAGDALRMQRNAALAAANAAEAKPEEMKSGEMVRHYLTAERDLWAARANQTIDVVTRKVLPKMQDREALGIAREYRNNPMELQSWIDGSHPFLEDADGGSATAMKRLDKLMPVMRSALRMIGGMSLREKTADKVFTNIATEDLAEGRKIGFLESRWLPDEYLPHALNKKGEGGVAKPPSTAGRQMGKIGKYFGFGERRSDRYPTLIHAVADGIIPKTLDPSALFTIHADGFARARATHLLEAHLVESGLGKWGDGKSTPEGWEQLAGHTEEFKHRQAYAVPGSFDPETRESELRVGLTGLYVKPFIAKALEPITDPDWTAKFPGFAKVRTAQRGLKEAILGLSGYHLLTENYMAAADMGLSAMYRAFRQPLEHPATLANERDLIGAGGTTSIQGSVMNAYRGLRPGTIPTRLEVIRGYLPGTKQALEVADSITRFTFDNVQRRYKVWAFALHRDAWVHDNPAATPEQLMEAKKGIASYVNGVYGGLHWENMGWSRAMVEIARLSFLAPDWSGSNMALAKYAADAPMSSEEIPFRSRLKGATSKESAQARLSRAFWTKQFVGGAIATQMLSLLITGKLSHRPFQVYLGKDPNGEDVYQNVFYRGSAGDTVSWWTKIEEHGLLVGSGLMVGSKLAPFAKVTEHLITGRDDLGRPITPKGMNPLVQTVRSVGSVMSEVSPVPITVRGIAKTTLGDQSGKYLWSERILGMFGPAAQHVPPAGTHMSGGVLRPNAEREENSAFDQMKTGQVYKRRGR